MADDSQYDSRLADLIWRSIKLRVSILVVCVLVLLITWSSLEVGTRKAAVVDEIYCLKVAEPLQQLDVLHDQDWNQQNPKYKITPFGFIDAHGFCTAINERVWLQQREKLTAGSYRNPHESANEKKIEADVLAVFSDYENKRKDAFRTDLKLTSEYSENSIEVNALSAASAIPFVTIGLLLLYTMLGNEEAGWVRSLRCELEAQQAESTIYRDIFVAKSQYFVSVKDSKGSRFLGFLWSPNKFAKTALLISALYLLLTVTSEATQQIGGFSDTPFEGYSFWLYTATFSAFIMAFLSKYHCSATETYRILRSRLIVGSLEGDAIQPQPRWRDAFLRLRTPMIAILASAAALSLSFPWAYENDGGNVFGYEWLMPRLGGIPLIGAAGRSMDLTMFREVRLEILAALLFLVVAVLCQLRALSRAPRLSGILRVARNVGAVIVLFLAFDYLMFMAVLQDEANDLYNVFNEHSGSMIFYNPTIGYWLFTGLCVITSLVCLSELLMSADRRY